MLPESSLDLNPTIEEIEDTTQKPTYTEITEVEEPQPVQKMVEETHDEVLDDDGNVLRWPGHNGAEGNDYY